MSRREEQLCWDCQRAVGGCPWSTMGKPVEGWTAQKTKIPNGCSDEYTESYHITACPLFKKDEKRLPAIIPGERISTRNLGLVLGVSGDKLRKISDEELLKISAEKGIEVELFYRPKRYVYVKRCKNGLL